MSGVPPPGYTGESMLSGGNGTIIPQSGGFSLMALGEPTSFGADVPPAPIAVGGDPIGDAMGKRFAREASHAAGVESMKPIAKPVVEYYSVSQKANNPLEKYTENVVKSMLHDSTSDANIKEIVASYVEDASKHWTAKEAPTVKGDPATMNRLIHFLPAGFIDTIVILPAVRGKLERFDYFLNFLTTIGVISQMQDEVGTLKEGVRVVFMSPFYGEPQTTKGANNNLALNYMFMKLKNANADKVFCLADHTPDSIAAAESINRIISPTGPLLSLLEPSYIRFTGPVGNRVKGLLIASDTGNIPERNGLLEEYASFTPVKGVRPESQEYITINTTDHTAINGLTRSGQCEALLLDPIPIEQIGTKIGLDREDKIAVIRLLVPNISPLPPLCKQKSILDGAPTFFAANIKATAKAPKTNIFYNDKLYRIRKPLTKVLSNWRAGVFTPGGTEFLGEADFLNNLGISPKLLGDIYGDVWVERLTEFLKGVSLSKCFSDEGLLTYMECDSSRTFIGKIENYMMDNDTSMDIPSLVPTAPKTIPNENGVSLDEIAPGGFMSEFKIGSHVVYATLTGWVMPVMIINRTSNEYILRQLSVNNKAAAEDSVKGYLNMYRQRYPDWLFLT